MIDLDIYFGKDRELPEGTLAFFADGLKLAIQKATVEEHALPDEVYRETNTDFPKIKNGYFVGWVDEGSFSGKPAIQGATGKTLSEIIAKLGDAYLGLFVFAIDLAETPENSALGSLARALNKAAGYLPVVLIARDRNSISLVFCDKPQKPLTVPGERTGKVSLLKRVDIEKPHSGHARIIKSLSVECLRENDKKNKVISFDNFYKGWQKVFAAEVLNKQFYRDFQQVYRHIVQEIFPHQLSHKLHAHQGALNLLNRFLFIYFVQQKGWLVNDKSFLFHLWQDYQHHSKGKDTFHAAWLNSLFFTAYNGSHHQQELSGLPKEYREAALHFSCLNGGLFIPQQETDGFLLKDAVFENIFHFLESYVFSIAEESFDQDVSLEINPALLGKMYEGMINAIDLDDVDAESGIVYTERPEINFMSRRSMVEVLDKKLNSDGNNAFSRDFLYHFCFDKPTERLTLLKQYRADGNRLKEAVLSTKACDPACGAGSMLLGVVQLQMELLKDLYIYQGDAPDAAASFQLKRKLISGCIYGVDIKAWAVSIAALRLWLYLIADAGFTAKDLHKSPLLPNLDFKLKSGNSLLQQVGGKDFSLAALLRGKDLKSGAAKKLNDYLREKKRFFQAQTTGKELSYDRLKSRETAVFKQFMEEQVLENRQRVKCLKGEVEKMSPKEKGIQKEIEELESEIIQLELLKAEIEQRGALPFSYDIDFMEIFFMQDNPGFDLIIGNPPYVRHELILPPEDADYLDRLLKEEHKAEKAAANAQYKKALSQKVFDTYPFLNAREKTVINGKAVAKKVYGDKVPGRSDLFVYFQLLSPQFLNSKGTLCFIISGSWLDADYGSFVQHFLLRNTHLQVLYDCIVRSFEASVNTVIYLHPALKNKKYISLQEQSASPSDEKVKFIMHKAEYSLLADAGLMIEEEKCEQSTQAGLFSQVVKSQAELFVHGFDAEAHKYTGDKWGAKYLRAPQIYFTILDKGRGKLVPLKTVATVRFGVKTGANDFFYLPNKAFALTFDQQEDLYRLKPKNQEDKLPHFKISKEYLKPILFSLKEADCPDLALAAISRFYFSANSGKEALGEAAAYVRWGEQLGFHNTATCAGRRPYWYAIDANFKPAHFIFPSKVGERFMLMDNRETKILEDKKQYGVCLHNGLDMASFLIWCNSTLYRLMVEQLSPQLTGAQAISDITTVVFKESPVLDLRHHSIHMAETALGAFMKRKQKSIFAELGFNKHRPLREQDPRPLADRKMLDDVVFDCLGLSEEERKEVYRATAELVKQRLDKAGSR